MTEQEAISLLEKAGFNRGAIERAAPDRNPIMRADDIGAALSAFALAFTNALSDAEAIRSVEDVLLPLAEELRELGVSMNDPSGSATPAKHAVMLTVTMIEGCAPDKETADEDAGRLAG